MHRFKKKSLMPLSGLLFALVSGCEQPAPPPQADIRITDRPVATIYKVKAATDTQTVRCYRLQNTGMTEMTRLQDEQLVNIVAIEEGLLQFDNQLWLHIYPRLTHRPSCYVNVDNLIPYG
jgi:hypothetical protein